MENETIAIEWVDSGKPNADIIQGLYQVVGKYQGRLTEDDIKKALRYVERTLGTTDLIQQFADAMLEAYGIVCPGWETDGTSEHMLENMARKMDDLRKAADK